jgi:hypothetical protein
VRHLVDADRDRHDQRIVLGISDFDAVGVAQAEPSLRNLRDRVAAPLDGVLVVDDVALRVEFGPAVERDRIPLSEGPSRLIE